MDRNERVVSFRGPVVGIKKELILSLCVLNVTGTITQAIGFGPLGQASDQDDISAI